jgi:Hemerythrin HHE cation binding domain
MTQLSYRPGDLATIAPSVGAVGADGADGADGAVDARLRLDAVLHRAVLRDLDRLTSVLAGPVTAVRRSALIGHVTFLTGELRRHWQLQDELIWPRAVVDDPSLAGAADQVRGDHLAAAAQCAGLVTAAEWWARVGDAEHRLLVLDAVREVAAVLAAVFERDGDVTAVALGALTSQDWAAIDRGVVRRRRRRPTTLARELFWFLDELDPASAAVLLAGVPPLRMWVLRNGFSGGYNRGSYLMWVGGGLGVPV